MPAAYDSRAAGLARGMELPRTAGLLQGSRRAGGRVAARTAGEPTDSVELHGVAARWAPVLGGS
jgi:hypothetical protein